MSQTKNLATIFIVDDNDTNLLVARDALKNHYRIMTMGSAKKFFEMIEKVRPVLVLLDIEMPGMDGFQVMEQLKADPIYREIPLIFLTANNDPAVEVRGFEMGAADFVTKPFSPPVLLNRIRHILEIESIIEERTLEISNLQATIIETLADVVERRDKDTGGHVERTSKYIGLLLEKLVAHGIYKDEIQALGIESLVTSSLLHDVGKIAVPDAILNKPGRLTDEEFEIIKEHSLEGGRIIDKIRAKASDDKFLESARILAVSHHEKWDGTGYPYQLAGADIPLEGRVMAVVDVYDALTSERSYKAAMDREEAATLIHSLGGKHFDPQIAQVFYEHRALFVS